MADGGTIHRSEVGSTIHQSRINPISSRYMNGTYICDRYLIKSSLIEEGRWRCTESSNPAAINQVFTDARYVNRIKQIITSEESDLRQMTYTGMIQRLITIKPISLM